MNGDAYRLDEVLKDNRYAGCFISVLELKSYDGDKLKKLCDVKLLNHLVNDCNVLVFTNEELKTILDLLPPIAAVGSIESKITLKIQEYLNSELPCNY